MYVYADGFCPIDCRTTNFKVLVCLNSGEYSTVLALARLQIVLIIHGSSDNVCKDINYFGWKKSSSFSAIFSGLSVSGEVFELDGE